MSSELILLILRLGFLLVLWLFVFFVVYALRSDLFGAPVRRMRGKSKNQFVPTPLPAAGPPAGGAPAAPTQPVITPTGGALPSAGNTGPARRLVILNGVAEGTAIPLDEGLVTVGRSPDSTLVIVDEYTSTYHARLQRVGETWSLTDLDSTNGTKVAGVRISSTVPLPTFTPVTIGTTTFELRP